MFLLVFVVLMQMFATLGLVAMADDGEIGSPGFVTVGLGYLFFIAVILLAGWAMEENAKYTALRTDELEAGVIYQPLGCFDFSGTSFVVLLESDRRFATYDHRCGAPDGLVIGQEYLATDDHELIPIR